MRVIKGMDKDGGISDNITVRHDTGLELLQAIWSSLEDGVTITIERVDSDPFNRNFEVIKGGQG